jgi:hypothetical protein
MTKKDFYEIAPSIAKLNDFVNEEGEKAWSFFNEIPILEENDWSLNRLILRCDDCHRAYYLVYKSSTRLCIVTAPSPQSLLYKLLSYTIDDNISLREEEMNRLIKETFFYFHYHKYYSSDSSIAKPK